MGFVEAIKSVFSKYAEFEGRARRSEYWYWVLLNVIVSLVTSGVGFGIGLAFSLGDAQSSALGTIWSLATLIPSLAVSVRRMHDIGKSGWSILIELIPIVGSIIFIVWCCRDSEMMPNEYGESPKYPSMANPYGYAPQQPQGFYPPQPNYYQPPVEQPPYAQPPVQSNYQPQAPQEPISHPTDTPNYYEYRVENEGE